MLLLISPNDIMSFCYKQSERSMSVNFNKEMVCLREQLTRCLQYSVGSSPVCGFGVRDFLESFWF